MSQYNIDTEAIYQKVIMALASVRRNSCVHLVYSKKREIGQFLVIRDDNYRAKDVGCNDYDLIGSYIKTPLPRLADIDGDVDAYLSEEEQKEYGVNPQLYGIIHTPSRSDNKKSCSG